jgi:hypothetical protein
MDAFANFLRRYFKGPDNSWKMRELGWCAGSLRSCRFSREAWSSDGVDLWVESYCKKNLKRMNIFMGVGYWLDAGIFEPVLENMYYDRIVYDFDSEENPIQAVVDALGFAQKLKTVYGCEPIVFESGFKGAHVVIPLKRPVKWSDYQLIWRHLLKLLQSRRYIDMNMLQWNRLDRVPLTWNVKEEGARFCRIVYPREMGWEDFEWPEPLDPSKVEVEEIVLPVVEVKVHTLKPRKGSRFEWVERVIERGLPDGRHRFILYVLSAYLMNVKKLSEDEAYQVVKRFLENSCKNFSNCGKVYDSFIRGDLRRVKAKGVKPLTLKRIRERDPKLYEILAKVLQADS